MEQEKLLTVTGDTIMLGSEQGSQLIFEKEMLGYGRAEIRCRGVKTAELELLRTRRYAFTKKTPPYYQIGPFCHRVSNVHVECDDGNKSTVTFYGGSAYYFIRAKVTAYADQPAFDIQYEVKAIHPFGDLAESPFVRLHFCPENSKLLFTQYGMQAPVTAQFDQRMEIAPQKSCVPFMFGMRETAEKRMAFGVGYHLDQPFEKGRLCYESTLEGGDFEIYPINPVSITGEVCSFHIVLAMGESQGECISAYRSICGYIMDTAFYRTAEDSERLFLSVYRDCKAYIEGKGYRQQIRVSTGEPAKGDVAEGAYGKFIPICSNVSLAYNLYKWWMRHPEDEWAKKRAIEMVDFFLNSQAEHGGVPNLYLDGEDRYITYVEYVRECRIREGRTEHPYPDGVCKYTTHMMSMAVYFLYRFYIARNEFEGCDCTEWKKSAIRAMDYLTGNVTEDGLVGRNYTDNGEWDDTCADTWLLIALDYFYEQTGKKAYADARDRMENWVNRTFADINHWYNWSADGGFWHGEGNPPINHDAFEVPTYATYCAYRYLHTKEEIYLKRARDAYEYLWLCMIPTQYSDYTHLTKGLIKEQDTYSTWDVPFNTTRMIDCLPYLTVITDDTFYMDFYRFILQVQMAYQAVDTKYPAFYIGLDWIEKDTIGEGDVAYISEFAGCIFLDSINSPYCYRYVGSDAFSIGLDYTPDFSPELKGSGFHSVFSTCKVEKCRWNTETGGLEVELSGEPGRQYYIGVRLEKGIEHPKKLLLQYGEESKDISSLYDEETGFLETVFVLPQEQKVYIKP